MTGNEGEHGCDNQLQNASTPLTRSDRERLEDMNSTAKSLILKAQDSIDTAKKMMADANQLASQHDAIGYNLAQSAEFLLKSLLAVRGIEFPQGPESHDLDALMELLEGNGFSAISSHADIIELTPYNSATAAVRKSERLDLKEYLGHVEDLKTLVGKTSDLG